MADNNFKMAEGVESEPMIASTLSIDVEPDTTIIDSLDEIKEKIDLLLKAANVNYEGTTTDES